MFVFFSVLIVIFRFAGTPSSLYGRCTRCTFPFFTQLNSGWSKSYGYSSTNPANRRTFDMFISNYRYASMYKIVIGQQYTNLYCSYNNNSWTMMYSNLIHYYQFLINLLTSNDQFSNVINFEIFFIIFYSNFNIIFRYYFQIKTNANFFNFIFCSTK